MNLVTDGAGVRKRAGRPSFGPVLDFLVGRKVAVSPR
jgi:hypothetical protein